MKNKMRPKLPHQLMRNQILGLISLGIIILIVQIIFFFYKNYYNTTVPNVTFEEKPSQHNILTKFNPNDLSPLQWKKLGFSESQVQTILKYKNIVGGQFSSKEQLKKCYAISPEKFAKLSPYILLPEQSQQRKSFANTSNYPKSLNIKQPFNPNHLTQKDWETMGFSAKQAQAILKYKHSLGGIFEHKEHIKSCFIISEEYFQQMSPYILLPEKGIKTQAITHQEKEEIQYVIFDPNLYSITDWQAIGFSQKQAQAILNYKNKKLKGSFRSLEDVRGCFVISDNKFEEMKPYIQLKEIVLPSNNIPKDQANITSIEVKTDFSQIDLNQITFKQLKEFGFDDKSARMFLGFRKKLGGFVKKDQILETYNIDKSLAQQLIATATLNSSTVVKYPIGNAPTEWLKQHPYFSASADKIIFCQQNHSSEKDIWKCIKASHKVSAKMSLYLQ